MSGHPVAVAAGRLVPPTRYRHPGDVIRLIAGGAVLACSLIALAVASKWLPAASRWLLGTTAPVVVGPGSSPAGRVLTGIVQVACVAAAALVVAATLRRRRFGLLGRLALAGEAATITATAHAISAGPGNAALASHEPRARLAVCVAEC